MIPYSGKDVEVMQVIVTRLETKGTGKQGSPIRRITQIWSMDGELLCEIDPHSEVIEKDQHNHAQMLSQAFDALEAERRKQHEP